MRIRLQKQQAEQLAQEKARLDRLKELEAVHKKNFYKQASKKPDCKLPSLDETIEQNDTTNFDETIQDNYDMSINREKLPSTEENYVLDISEGDSTDEEDNPKKSIPQWAVFGKEFNELLRMGFETAAEMEFSNPTN